MKKINKLIPLILILLFVFQIYVFADGNSMTLKLKNESAYIYGYTDTCIGAENNITRAEASALLHRLLKQNNVIGGYIKPNIPSYWDVGSNTWFYTAIEFMTYKGVYDSVELNEIFHPYAPITRAEAAKMFVVSLELKPNKVLKIFDDINNSHKFFEYVNTMAGNAYMVGDAHKKTIRPDSFLTRAEFVVIYNRIIGRNQSYSTTKTITGDRYVCPFEDMDKDDWYYDDIVRATNSYTSRKIDLSKRNDRNSLDEYKR